MLALYAQAQPLNADTRSSEHVGSQDETEIPVCAICPRRAQLRLLQPILDLLWCLHAARSLATAFACMCCRVSHTRQCRVFTARTRHGSSNAHCAKSE